MQHTIKAPVSFAGKGLHSGVSATLTIRPAAANQGIWFRRTDLDDGRDTRIQASWDAVSFSSLCTRIENTDGVSVSTIEHLMAALAGCGIHNAWIELDGPEVPILDGSSAPFVAAILKRGLRRQDAPLTALRILQPVEVRRDDAVARLLPDVGFRMSFLIEFDEPAIGRQAETLDLANGSFVHELSNCRTFCRKSDVEKMHAAGMALGGSYENAIVFDGDRVLSPGGLRHSKEAVRHKMLDALGDLALAGMPILGRYEGERAGHALTNALLRKLFSIPGAFEAVNCDERICRHLPGAFSAQPALV